MAALPDQDFHEHDSPWRPLVMSPCFRLVLLGYFAALMTSATYAFREGEVAFFIAISVPFFWMGFSFRGLRRWLYFGITGLLLLLSTAFQSGGHGRLSYAMSDSKRNLNQIGHALHNYHDAHGRFPPPSIASEDGQPMHSWRVLILPFAEYGPRLAYELSEPWNGPHNRVVGEEAIEVYHDPLYHEVPSPTTNYFAVTGPHTAWSAGGCRREDFRDGTSNTILAIETSAVSAKWIEPRDLSFDEAVETLCTVDAEGAWLEVNYFYDVYLGRHILFADGTARRTYPMSQEAARALLTIDGGEPTPDLPMPSPDSFRRYHPFKHAYKLPIWAQFLIVAGLPGGWLLLAQSPNDSIRGFKLFTENDRS